MTGTINVIIDYSFNYCSHAHYNLVLLNPEGYSFTSSINFFGSQQ